MRKDGQIDYIELPAPDIAAAKRFYGVVCGWTFEDYGPDYCAFKDGRLDGGFRADATPAGAQPVVVLFAHDLDAFEKKVAAAGAVILEHHVFPGGRRFHFRDPNGNVLAVWSDR